MQAFLDWLVVDFYVYGVHLQNWMLMVAAALAIFIIVSWHDHRRPRG